MNDCRIYASKQDHRGGSAIGATSVDFIQEFSLLASGGSHGGARGFLPSKRQARNGRPPRCALPKTPPPEQLYPGPRPTSGSKWLGWLFPSVVAQPAFEIPFIGRHLLHGAVHHSGSHDVNPSAVQQRIPVGFQCPVGHGVGGGGWTSQAARQRCGRLALHVWGRAFWEAGTSHTDPSLQSGSGYLADCLHFRSNPGAEELRLGLHAIGPYSSPTRAQRCAGESCRLEPDLCKHRPILPNHISQGFSSVSPKSCTRTRLERFDPPGSLEGSRPPCDVTRLLLT